MTEKERRIKELLKQLLDFYELEDKSVRERQIRVWRQLKLYWESIANFYYSSVAHDWRVWDNQLNAESNSNQDYYNKPVNIFRAYLESIFAALSVQIPAIDAMPDDADNPEDITTAKAARHIYELVSKYNEVDLKWLYALFIYGTEGAVAAYNYVDYDKRYGERDEKEYEDVTVDAYQCDMCGTELPDELFTQVESDEYGPDDNDVAIKDVINEGGIVCPACGMQLDPALQKSPLVITRLVGITKEPKARQCIEPYGGLYVKFPNYAKTQYDCPYIIFSKEENVAKSIEDFPHLGDELCKKNTSAEAARGPLDTYGAWGRLSPQYNGEYPVNTTTRRQAWFRPWSFNVLQEEDTKFLKKEFPDGVKCTFINEDYGDSCNEALDDHWTITKNPMSDYLHHNPIGMLLVSMQDITNDLVSLTVQTIEHGIPQTFVNPKTVDLDSYEQSEVTVGGLFPAQPIAGKAISDSFYEVKTATLSAEVLPFLQQIQQLGQVVSGALPSLFGGNLQDNKTASGYAMSRQQALQRLGTTWKMFTIWWKEIWGKVIPAYIKCAVEDEHYVQKDNQGDYINVFIRKAELQGKIGNIELEASEQLPTTWAQKKETIMTLLQTNNEFILAALSSPENLPFVASAIGLDEFVIPGEEDRQKQYEEIKELLNATPIPTGMPDMMTGQMQEQPSVEVDPVLDNHQVESDICRSWAISEAGRQAKVDNPQGYKNVLLHMKAHLDILAQQVMQQQQQMMMQQMMAGAQKGAANPPKPNKDMKAPIKDNKDVSTVQ